MGRDILGKTRNLLNCPVKKSEDSPEQRVLFPDVDELI
jgi:hypothetical protein